MCDFDHIKSDLKNKLTPERFDHTLGVMYMAAALAMRYDFDIHKAMLSGLLHDCGKLSPQSEQIRLCEKYNIFLSDSERAMPALVHAKLGAYLAKNLYKVRDEDVTEAVLYHTTGKPDMTLLEKIIYVADFIEPDRKNIAAVENTRGVAFIDIDRAACLCAEATISYLNRTGRAIDPLTINTYEFYKKCNQKEERL